MTENEIIKLGLKPRSITEKKLVEIFATPSMQERYSKEDKFASSDKARLLQRARRFCEIRDDGNRQYYISKVYENPLPSNFDKMNKDLYQYICPLILTSLVNHHDKHNKITMTVGVWAREIEMVNNNYTKVEDKFGIDKAAFYDFYDRCDEAIDYYIIQALKYLQSAGLIIWREVYFVQPTTPEVLKDGQVYRAVEEPKPRPATEEDMKFYTECVKAADEKANIKNAKERYYSIKSKLFRQTLMSKLHEKEIRYIYKSYEAYYINPDRCSAVLDMFDQNDIINRFNEAFINKLATNAESRKLQEKFKNCTDYIGNFLALCDMTINNNTENLEERLK